MHWSLTCFRLGESTHNYILQRRLHTTLLKLKICVGKTELNIVNSVAMIHWGLTCFRLGESTRNYILQRWLHTAVCKTGESTHSYTLQRWLRATPRKFVKCIHLKFWDPTLHKSPELSLSNWSENVPHNLPKAALVTWRTYSSKLHG